MTEQFNLPLSDIPKPGLYWARVKRHWDGKIELKIVRFNDGDGDQWFDILEEHDGDIIELADAHQNKSVELIQPIGEPSA